MGPVERVRYFNTKPYWRMSYIPHRIIIRTISTEIEQENVLHTLLQWAET